MRRAFIVIALALAPGCDPGFEKPSIVLDLRVLAMAADPPEVILDVDRENPQPVPIPPVRVTALLADPASDRRLAWRLTLCLPTSTGRCDDPEEPVRPVAEGMAEDPEGPAAAAGPCVEGTVAPDTGLLQAALEDDPMAGFGGIRLQVSLRAAPEHGSEADAVYAFKRILYAPRQPPSRTANRNPTIADLLAGDASFAGGRCGDPSSSPLVVAPGQDVRFAPVEPEGVRETYVLPTFDGGARTLEENVAYAWFATAGSFSREETGGRNLLGSEPPLDTRWTAPSAEEIARMPGGLVHLWLVQRDDRGGSFWTTRCLAVGAESSRLAR